MISFKQHNILTKRKNVDLFLGWTLIRKGEGCWSQTWVFTSSLRACYDCEGQIWNHLEHFKFLYRGRTQWMFHSYWPNSNSLGSYGLGCLHSPLKFYCHKTHTLSTSHLVLGVSSNWHRPLVVKQPQTNIIPWFNFTNLVAYGFLSIMCLYWYIYILCKLR